MKHPLKSQVSRHVSSYSWVRLLSVVILCLIGVYVVNSANRLRFETPQSNRLSLTPENRMEISPDKLCDDSLSNSSLILVNRTLVVAVFVEQPHSVENLRFFLLQGIIANDPLFHFVIIVNGNCSAYVTRMLKLAATICNVHVRFRPNVGFDSCAWRQVLGNDTNLQPPLPISVNSFTFVITINFSIRGPFLSPGDEKPWTLTFSSLLRGPSDVRLAGTTISCHPVLHIQVSDR